MKRFIIEAIEKDTLALLATECPDLPCGEDDAWYASRARELLDLEEYNTYLVGETGEWSTSKMHFVESGLRQFVADKILSLHMSCLTTVKSPLKARLGADQEAKEREEYAEFMNAREAR